MPRLGTQSLLPFLYSPVVTAKAAVVCPEGKEASVGRSTSRGTEGLWSQGRRRSVKGLSTRLQLAASRARAKLRAVEVLRVLRRTPMAPVRASHTAPLSPARLTAFITLSRRGPLPFF